MPPALLPLGWLKQKGDVAAPPQKGWASGQRSHPLSLPGGDGKGEPLVVLRGLMGGNGTPLNAQLFISTPLAHVWQLRPAAGHSHFSALDAQGTATAEVTQTKLSSSRPSSVHLTSIARATTTPLSRCWLLESSWALPGPQQVSMQQQRKQGATVHHLPGGLGSLGLEKKENDYKPEPPPLLWPRDGPRQHSLCTCNKSDLLCACQHTP